MPVVTWEVPRPSRLRRKRCWFRWFCGGEWRFLASCFSPVAPDLLHQALHLFLRANGDAREAGAHVFAAFAEHDSVACVRRSKSAGPWVRNLVSRKLHCAGIGCDTERVEFAFRTSGECRRCFARSAAWSCVVHGGLRGDQRGEIYREWSAWLGAAWRANRDGRSRRRVGGGEPGGLRECAGDEELRIFVGSRVRR